MTKIIDGKKFAENLREKIKSEVEELKKKTNKTPGLAVILVGEDPASQVYVRNKAKQTLEVGMQSFEFKYPDNIDEKTLISKIDELNKNPEVNGILVQLPLPKHISEDAVISSISAEKDVDGFNVINRGLLVTGNKKALIPCTPLGSLMLIKDVLGENISGKNAVVIGRSNIVGKPMSHLLINEGCTVTICHSKTKNIEEVCKTADILVVAVGKPLLVKKNWVKQGAVVIDVGINRVENKLVGDVDFADVSPIASAITPVPGGVGPMTIACLLNNTLQAFKNVNKII
ncbi:MAG: bifunctional methylenetetrahydrofolate dehydrogenase/methenyltetrahydrofolate cyclohydrolase FolD [Rickettsiales bacterium]|nr:bifunctional methylenetetrahydrofolate dehydrogenase/methenyltetrahydrofolate cyclohydrolase FolD [Rickettsiales bacterium]